MSDIRRLYDRMLPEMAEQIVFVEFERLLKIPLRLLHEDPLWVITSATLSAAEPRVENLFVVTENKLLDVVVSYEQSFSFDVIDLRTIGNMRMSMGKHRVRVPVEGGPPEDHHFTSATLVMHHHGLASTVGTRMDFFGENALGWVDYVVNAIPLTTVR